MDATQSEGPTLLASRLRGRPVFKCLMLAIIRSESELDFPAMFAQGKVVLPPGILPGSL